MDAISGKLVRGGAANVEEIRHREGPDLVAERVFPDLCHSVRFLHIGTQLGEYLIEADSDGNREPCLRLHRFTDLIGYIDRGAMLQQRGPGHLDPALIDPKCLHFGRVPQIDCPYDFREFQILLHVWRNNGQLRTLLLCLPNDIARLDAAFLGQLVLRQYDPMPLLCTAADSKICPSQFRVQHTLNTGIAVVEVAVEYNPIAHSPTLAFGSMEVL